MAEFDNNGPKNRHNPANVVSSGGAVQKPQPAKRNSQQPPISQAPLGPTPNQPSPPYPGRPQQTPVTPPPLNNQAQRPGHQTQVPPTDGPSRQGTGALMGNQPGQAGIPPRPPANSPYPGTAVPGRPSATPYAGSAGTFPAAQGRVPAQQSVLSSAGAADIPPATPGRPPGSPAEAHYAGAAGTFPAVPGRPLVRQPASPYAGAVGVPPATPGRPPTPQPAAPYGGGANNPSTVSGRPSAQQPVSPYAGAAIAAPVAPGPPSGPQPVSPYAGASVSSPGSASGQSAPIQPTSLYAGAAVAAPRVTAAIDDEEKKQLEDQERTQRYSELTFFEKVSFAATLTWGYRTNFICGAVAVVVFNWCLQHLIEKHFGNGGSSLLFGLPVLFLSTFASLFAGVCFATVISYIADNGDPDSTIDLLFAPTTGSRFITIAPALGVWALVYSAINLLLFSMDKSPSIVNVVVNVVVVSCIVPLTMCVIYYIADNDEFNLIEGVAGPFRIFCVNIIDWLLFVPVSIFIFISTLLAIMAVLSMPPVGFMIIGVMVVLSLIIIMLCVCYIFVYGCYVYKETAAKVKLASEDG